MSSSLIRFLFTCTALSFMAAPCLAAGAGDPFADRLLGDLGGARDVLADHGMDLTLDYKADLWNNSGGIKDGSNYFGELDTVLDVDGEKTFGIAGNTVHISFIMLTGSNLNAHLVGSAQGVDNYEGYVNTTKLYEAYVQQQFFDDKLSLLFGVHDLNGDFAVVDMGLNFIKPTLQLGQSLAQTGGNGPGAYPETGLAGRVRVTPTEQTYAMAAVFEGIPGDPDHLHGTHFSNEDNEGLLLIAEAGWVPPAPEGMEGDLNKLGIGFWRYTAEQPDLVGPGSSNQEGAYLISSYQFYYDKAASRGIGAFLTAGMDDGNSEQTDWDLNAGLVGNGWIPGRPEGQIGLGVSYAHNSHDYIASVGSADNAETSYELYYRDTIYRGVAVQPDIQYVVNPGTDPTLDGAAVIGVRLDINI